MVSHQELQLHRATFDERLDIWQVIVEYCAFLKHNNIAFNSDS